MSSFEATQQNNGSEIIFENKYTQISVILHWNLRMVIKGEKWSYT